MFFDCWEILPTLSEAQTPTTALAACLPKLSALNIVFLPLHTHQCFIIVSFHAVLQVCPGYCYLSWPDIPKDGLGGLLSLPSAMSGAAPSSE